jgi:hypothetical protein
MYSCLLSLSLSRTLGKLKARIPNKLFMTGRKQSLILKMAGDAWFNTYYKDVYGPWDSLQARPEWKIWWGSSIKGTSHWDTDKLISFGGPSSIYIPEATSSTRTYLSVYLCTNGARGSVVGWGTMPQGGPSRVRFPIKLLDFSIDLILPASLWPWGRLSL